jgi:hypothetical protein
MGSTDLLIAIYNALPELPHVSPFPPYAHSIAQVGSHAGVVLSIDSRYVRLQTEDGQQILLPSYQVYSQAIIVQEKTDKFGRPIPAAAKLDTSAAAAAAAAGSTPPSKPPPSR